jgi:hypothetical protein
MIDIKLRGREAFDIAGQLQRRWAGAAPRPTAAPYENASITRSIAGCLRFFTFTQCFDLPTPIRPIPALRH